MCNPFRWLPSAPKEIRAQRYSNRRRPCTIAPNIDELFGNPDQFMHKRFMILRESFLFLLCTDVASEMHQEITVEPRVPED